MIKTIMLSPGITLRCFPDQRFKQGCLSVQFLRPMCRDEVSLNALLPAVLLRGCAGAPDLRDITLRLDDLYGASIGAQVRRIGNIQTTGLVAGFMEDRYAFDGDAILQPVTEFLRELLLEPLTENGVFSEEYVESEKTNLISAIESQKNDKRAYAVSQMLKIMCKNDSFGIPRLGEIPQVRAITAENLYAHYQKILRESPIDLFYVGSAQPEEVAQMLKPLVSGLAQHCTPLPAQTVFTGSGFSQHTEVMDIAQGKLCMGYTTDITLTDSRFPAMQMANTIFGAGMTSKLFMNVREKMSLCYDIGSGYHGSKGIILVNAGIDFCQEQKVRQEVQNQLDEICAGRFTAEEIEAARQMLLTQLEAVHDSPGAIESYYATAAISGLNMTPEQYREAVIAVTPEQISEAAGTLHLDTVYFLKGEQ